MVPAAVSRFRAENRVFDPLHKILYCSTGLRGENSFYCGSIWSKLVLIHKKKNFQNRKFFHVGNEQNVSKKSEPKNHVLPIFDVISQKKLIRYVGLGILIRRIIPFLSVQQPGKIL